MINSILVCTLVKQRVSNLQERSPSITTNLSPL